MFAWTTAIHRRTHSYKFPDIPAHLHGFRGVQQYKFLDQDQSSDLFPAQRVHFSRKALMHQLEHQKRVQVICIYIANPMSNTLQ